MKGLHSQKSKQGVLLLALELALPFWACANVKGVFLPSPLDPPVSLIGAGNLHTYAVVRDGLKCWGSADAGKLGLAGITSKHDAATPMDVRIDL